MRELRTDSGASNKFGPLKIVANGNDLILHCPPYFRDQSWSDEIGSVQSAIAHWADSLSGCKRSFRVDLSACRWIDPLPAISVALEAVREKLSGADVQVILPKPDDGSLSDIFGPYQETPNRVVRFLVDEGFCEALVKNGIAIISEENEPIVGTGWEPYNNAVVEVSYKGAHCVGFNLIDISGETEHGVPKIVDRLLEGAELDLGANVPRHRIEYLICKLRVALQELIHNVQEHAYNSDQLIRLVGIYVRYRRGGADIAGSDLLKFQRHITEERQRCPKLGTEWLEGRRGCLELFVLDQGQGLVKRFVEASERLNSKGSELDKIAKSSNKLRAIMYAVMARGHSTKPEDRRLTEAGGLQLLHRLLDEAGDYVRVLDDGVWFGTTAPIIREKAATYIRTNDRIHLRGLAINLRLDWKARQDIGAEWAPLADDPEVIWKEMSRDEISCSESFQRFSKSAVIDDRFQDLSPLPLIDLAPTSEMLLWRVRPHLMKWDIISYLEKAIATSIESSRMTLIITDIPSYEASIYKAALSNFRTMLSWPGKFLHIILVTDRMRFAIVSSVRTAEQRGQYGFSSLATNIETITIKVGPSLTDPSTFRLFIHRWMKWHDSNRYWKEISESKIARLFFDEPIVWSDGESQHPKIIEGYLDFAQSTHNRVCRLVLRSVLSRLLGIVPIEALMPVDRLTAPVLQDLYGSETYDDPVGTFSIRLALGSVLVSGATAHAAGTYRDVHFFAHPNSPLSGQKAAMLYWFPEKRSIDAAMHAGENRPTLKRVGKTHAVAPDGWKSFEVPRFDRRDKPKPFGWRYPADTYLEDWQSVMPVIAKSGHWSYEGHHDFLTINIGDTVRYAFFYHNELCKFLVVHILSFIGITEKHCEPGWASRVRGYLEGIPPEMRKRLELKKPGVMVYRSHPTTELVVKNLLGLLNETGRNLALSRIYPVLPIRSRSSGSTLLISPLTQKSIREALEKTDANPDVLLFDDAAISGRTLNDLRSAVKSVGARTIRTVVIVNRLRQPAEATGSERIEYFWRLDVPTMGHDGNCPLCNAVDRVSSFSTNVVTKAAKAQLDEWKKTWQPISPLTDWTAGLAPTPLKPSRYKVRFCYRQDFSGSEEDKYLEHIDLIQSTGAVIHVSELHAMTGADDYVIRKIDEQQEAAVRIELAVSQILLFGNEFDQDIHLKLIQRLIKELGSVPNNSIGSPHVSIAVLGIVASLSAIPESGRMEAMRCFLEPDWSFEGHLVTQILLAYLVNEHLLSPGTEAYDIGEKLLSTRALSLANCMRALFLETHSSQGYAHYGWLPKLIAVLQSGGDATKKKIEYAAESLERLAELIAGLPPYLVRYGERTGVGFSMTHFLQSAKSVRNLLSEEVSGKKEVGWAQETLKRLKELVNAVDGIADGYFFRINSVADYYDFWQATFENRILRPLIDGIDWMEICRGKNVRTREYVIHISKRGKKLSPEYATCVWIVWTQTIATIVYDLLVNAVYAKAPIRDPDSIGENNVADMWLLIDYDQKGIHLSFANQTNRDRREVFTELAGKRRWEDLRELGGKVELDESDRANPQFFRLRLSIPYAAYLVTVRG
jgi:hypothetical protein